MTVWFYALFLFCIPFSIQASTCDTAVDSNPQSRLTHFELAGRSKSASQWLNLKEEERELLPKALKMLDSLRIQNQSLDAKNRELNSEDFLESANSLAQRFKHSLKELERYQTRIGVHLKYIDIDFVNALREYNEIVFKALIYGKVRRQVFRPDTWTGKEQMLSFKQFLNLGIFSSSVLSTESLVSKIMPYLEQKYLELNGVETEYLSIFRDNDAAFKPLSNQAHRTVNGEEVTLNKFSFASLSYIFYYWPELYKPHIFRKVLTSVNNKEDYLAFVTLLSIAL